MLSRNDIEKALIDGHLKIFPFEKKNLTGIGYNISTTDFAFSISRGILLTVHKKTIENKILRYVIIPKNDTVLFFSREYIEVDSTLAGTFHSKVSCVSQGLGHISTTLDPTWKGQLLISVNNPTTNDIFFDLDKTGGNIITLLLHKLDTPVTGDNIHDNNQGRCELLISHFSTPASNKKYTEKNLEVKEFVENELSDSLNGYDNFLDFNQPRDRFSVTVEQLTRLLERLKSDHHAISEGRYRIDSNGKYYCLKSDNELELLKKCAIFYIDSKLSSVLWDQEHGMTGISENRLSEACEPLYKCIKVIEYELKMIEHVRRVHWQNCRVNKFAGEDSELVVMRNNANKVERRKRFWIPLICIIVFTGIFFGVLIGVFDAFSPGNSIGTIFTTLYAPVLVFVVQNWWNYWRAECKTKKTRIE